MLYIIVGIVGLIFLGMAAIGIMSGVNPQGKTQKDQQNAVQINNQNGTQVEIKNFSFNPKTITIKVGDSVTWKNSDLPGHSATADDGSWDTDIITQGESATIKFEKAGTYTYYCKPHPFMKGTIVVE